MFKIKLALLIAGLIGCAALPESASASIVDYTVTLTDTAGLSGTGDLKFDTSFLLNGNAVLTPTGGGVTNLVIDIGTSVFDLTNSFTFVTIQLGKPISITDSVRTRHFLLRAATDILTKLQMASLVRERYRSRLHQPCPSPPPGR